MKNRKMVSLLLAVVMTAVLLAVPAQAAEAPSAVRVGSYKGNTLTVGEISGLMIYPSTANDSVVSSDPAVVRVGNVLDRWTATAQGPGTAVITVTAPDGRAGNVTITVKSEGPAEPTISGEADDTAAYSEVRQELVRLINQTRAANGVSELPVSDALMNAAQACSDSRYTWHHTKEECEAVIAAGYLHGFGVNLTVFTGVTAEDSDRYSRQGVVVLSVPKERRPRQMSKNVTIIPPSEGRPDTLRVAAYCRVSTDMEEQASSYASQIRSYTELISQHEGWELVDIYADEAVSGTKTDKREDFNRLLADCRKGKIDRVLVKSISRFSRNTKDCLAALRELMRLGVTVQFEKENIDTGTLTTELMVSVSGSLAQQESISISQNIRQGYRRRMERGEFITNKPPYGYRNAGDGKLEIIPEEAEIIRWVFDLYLNGYSPTRIAEEMNRRGIRKKYGKAKWSKISIVHWLENEKYTGSTLCQKTFSSSFPFVKKENRGELDQFYVENSHPAIISKEIFERVQALRQHKKISPVEPTQYPLTRKMVCGNCGATLYRNISNTGNATWICSQHMRSAAACPTKPIWERDAYTAFIRMYNKLRLHESIILQPALDQMEALESAVQRENPAMLEINRAIAQATEQNYKISKLRSSGLLDADACAAKLAALDAQLTQLRVKRRKLLKNDDISEVAEVLRQTVNILHQGPDRLEDFDAELFADLVERVVADPNHGLRFRLSGGFEVIERLREDER